eukprot:g3810.t1
MESQRYRQPHIVSVNVRAQKTSTGMMRKCDRIFKKFDERAELFGSLLDNLAKDVATPKKTSRPILAQRDQSSESIAVSKNNGRNRTECALCLYEFPMDSLVSYASYSSIQKFRNRPAASMQSQTPPPASLAERSREEDDISSSDEEWTEEESSEDDEYPSEEEVQRVSSLLAQLADENASLQKQLLDLKKEQVEVLAAKKYYIELRRRRRKTNHELTLRRQEEFWTGGVSTGGIDEPETRSTCNRRPKGKFRRPPDNIAHHLDIAA